MSIPEPSSGLETLQKYPDESRVYAFDFADVDEVAAGAELVTPSVTVEPADSVIVVGQPSVSGTEVFVQISAGVPGTTYLIGCDVETTAAPPATLSMFAKLFIIDPSLL